MPQVVKLGVVKGLAARSWGWKERMPADQAWGRRIFTELLPSLVDLPPDYSEERPPPPNLAGSRMLSLGLQPQSAGREVKRSARFTSLPPPTLRRRGR